MACTVAATLNSTSATRSSGLTTAARTKPYSNGFKRPSLSAKKHATLRASSPDAGTWHINPPHNDGITDSMQLPPSPEPHGARCRSMPTCDALAPQSKYKCAAALLPTRFAVPIPEPHAAAYYRNCARAHLADPER